MTNLHHLEMGAATARASDRVLGEFAYHCAKVVRVNFLDAGTGEQKPGALALAQRAGLSRDWIEDHAIAFRLLVELFQRGYSVQAKYYWRKLYKSHWITVAVDWRRHQDFEIALNDLETFDNEQMNPDEAKKSKDRDKSLAERLHQQQATLERQLQDFQSLADKDRKLLPYIKELRSAYTDHYRPALEKVLAHIERVERIEKNVSELGYRKGVYQ